MSVECPEKLSELGGLSKLSVPKLTDLYCTVEQKQKKTLKFCLSATVFRNINIQCFVLTELTCPYGRPWTPPANWPAVGQPAYYHDFETTECVTLNNGAKHANSGKVTCF